MSTADPRIVAKVRKLLALSDSPNEHEASVAMEKAHEFLLRHGLDLAEIATADASAVDVEDITVIGEAHRPWQRDLAQAVADAMGGRALFRLGDQRTQRDDLKPAVVFVGPTGTVSGMLELYRQLEMQLETEADIETAMRPEKYIPARTCRRSFLLGAVEQIAERLALRRSAITEEGANSEALAVLKTAVDQAIEDRYPNLRTLRDPAEPDWEAYVSGGESGSNIDLGDERLSGRRALPAGAPPGSEDGP